MANKQIKGKHNGHDHNKNDIEITLQPPSLTAQLDAAKTVADLKVILAKILKRIRGVQ